MKQRLYLIRKKETMMKKLLCALLTLLMLGSQTVALAESCKYAGQGGPCEIKWWVDTEKRQHCRACFYHVEDKEDINSHVPITEWTDCTLDEGTGKCSGCGYTYNSTGSSDAENQEKYLTEYFMAIGMEAGTAPVDASISGSTLEIGFARYFRNEMMEKGYLTSESLMVASEYTLILPGGSTYAWTGEAVTPEIRLEKTDYGSGVWLEENGMLTIGSPMYVNNTTPGTATVSVDITVKMGKTYTLSKTFTIEGAAAERLPGDAGGNGSVDLNDAIAILCACAGESVAINTSNADVTGDGEVDLYDALRILQYIAGWNVTLK